MAHNADLSARSHRNDCTAISLARARAALRARTPDQLDSAGLREAWRVLHETWLTAKAAEIGVDAASGFAIVAIGSLGRREMLPHSDLDLLLLHDGKQVGTVAWVAEQLWYPLWDANVRLDHSVRTVIEALQVADADIVANLGLLDARHIAGDERLSAQLIEGVRSRWRSGIRFRYDELVETTRERWQRCGEIAHRAEPDLKGGRGGLRDVQLLDALSVAQLADSITVGGAHGPMSSPGRAVRTLLDVRTELHRISGRGDDVLMSRNADDISVALRLVDRCDLARRLSDAAEAIRCRVDTVLRDAADPLRVISAARV